jgi:tetratricopeptide (TPR) repeat protein
MIGTSLGPYRVLEKLGAGGMGEVYRAHDTQLKRDVALKVLPSAVTHDAARLARFEREAELLAALNHPHIVTIHAVLESPGGRAIVMELVRGCTLRTVVAERPGSDVAVRLGLQVAAALAAAHAAGLVHRDLKPENVMVRDDGYVKVLDFGVARLAAGAADASSAETGVDTTPGVVVGTWRYMAPEQAAGATVTGAADVFALGLVIYELATGRHPFEAEANLATAHRIATEPLTPASRLNPTVPPPLDALLSAMLEKEPRRRPTAAEVVVSLTALGPQMAPPATVPAAGHARRTTVGRNVERGALLAAFDEVVRGRGLFVGLAGEAGIGKTTLVETFVADLEAGGRACTFARGRCSERLAGAEAYLPWLEALESLVRGEGGAARAGLLETLAPTWYAQVMPLAPDDSSAARLLADVKTASQERLKRELAAFLEELGRRQPVVLFFDDLHWADASTVDLLAYVGTRLETMRVLVIGAYRPSDLQREKHPFVPVKLELQAHRLAREIAVEFLTREDLIDYLALEFPAHHLPADLVELLHARTEGNALFMADLLRYLRDRGVVGQQDGTWALSQSVTEIARELPESIRSMIEKKIGQLGDGDRRLLAAASVQGYEFDSAVVAATLGTGQAEVEERLEEIDRAHGLVRLAGDRELPDATLTLRYRFVHLLYQNVLYDLLSATRKAALSAAVADALLRFHGERASEVASDLALLFETARDHARAADFFLKAAVNARRVRANREAIALARRAIASAEKLRGTARHAGVAAAVMFLGGVHLTLSQYEDARVDYARAEEAARDREDLQGQVFAIYGQAVSLNVSNRRDGSRQLALRALEMSRASGFDVGVATAETLLGSLAVMSGDLAEAGRYYERSVPVLQRDGPPSIAVGACLVPLMLHQWRLEHAKFGRLLEWMRPRLDETGSIDLFHCRYVGALALANQGRLSDALSELRDVSRLMELNGERFYLSRVPNALGWVHRELFDMEAALKFDRDGVRLAREMNSDEPEANSHVNLARDYLELGELASVSEHLDEAERIFDRDDWYRWRYMLRLENERASYWIARGDLKQAATHAAVALESGKKTLSRKHWAWAHKLLGDIALLEDRAPDAGRDYGLALSILEGHACPIVEWRILAAAADAARRLHDGSSADDLRGRARRLIQGLAESITETPLRERFLDAKAIREI